MRETVSSRILSRARISCACLHPSLATFHIPFITCISTLTQWYSSYASCVSNALFVFINAVNYIRKFLKYFVRTSLWKEEIKSLNHSFGFTCRGFKNSTLPLYTARFRETKKKPQQQQQQQGKWQRQLPTSDMFKVHKQAAQHNQCVLTSHFPLTREIRFAIYY